MIIDFHTHYYPEKIAGKAIEAVASIPGMQAYTDGTLNGLLKSMDVAGIDLCLGLPLANTPDNVRGVNRWAAINNNSPVYLLGSIHPDTPEPEKMIEWIAGQGLRGIKIHPEYQQFSFDEERLFPIWEACIEHNLFVLTHTGNDINFPPPARSNPRQLAAFHRRFPELKLVLAHLGSWGMWNEVSEQLAGLPVYFDLAFTVGYLSQEDLLRLIRQLGTDRVLFGTDSPWRDQKTEVEYFQALPLTDEEKSCIFYRNAVGLLGLDLETVTK
ncbi:MAG: amidohydrolase family protein [Victivallaceae bacterium]